MGYLHFNDNFYGADMDEITDAELAEFTDIEPELEGMEGLE